MSKFQHRYLSDEQWLITEAGYDRAQQGVSESRLSLGNGVLGCRGVLDGKPLGSTAGTYLAGFYDGTNALVTELVNLPNPFRLRFALRGERLSVARMETTDHLRVLDLGRGLLYRQTSYRDARGRKYEYESIRFLSMHDRQVGVIQACVTALDESVELTVTAGTDMDVYTAGTITEGPKKHWSLREVSHRQGIEYVRIAGLDCGYPVAIASQVIFTLKGRTRTAPDSVFRIRLQPGQTVWLSKFVVIQPSPDGTPGELHRVTTSRLKRATAKGFDRLLSDHRKAWEQLWVAADIAIDGAPEIQRQVRFNIYHLLCCAPAPGSRLSVGARSLSGDGYRGHVFWDADIFVLPFFIHSSPPTALEMLLYRYDRLNAARLIAKQAGYRGAMFPWESADTGEEETPASTSTTRRRATTISCWPVDSRCCSRPRDSGQAASNTTLRSGRTSFGM
jgi:kojibiose phosphorylase